MYMYTYLVLPLKLRPHLPELSVSAGGWLDVVHDVDVDVVEYHAVPVRGGANDVIDCECVCVCATDKILKAYSSLIFMSPIDSLSLILIAGVPPSVPVNVVDCECVCVCVCVCARLIP